jgi:hypothetical protein
MLCDFQYKKKLFSDPDLDIQIIPDPIGIYVENVQRCDPTFVWAG